MLFKWLFELLFLLQDERGRRKGYLHAQVSPHRISDLFYFSYLYSALYVPFALHDEPVPESLTMHTWTVILIAQRISTKQHHCECIMNFLYIAEARKLCVAVSAVGMELCLKKRRKPGLFHLALLVHHSMRRHFLSRWLWPYRLEVCPALLTPWAYKSLGWQGEQFDHLSVKSCPYEIVGGHGWSTCSLICLLVLFPSSW